MQIAKRDPHMFVPPLVGQGKKWEPYSAHTVYPVQTHAHFVLEKPTWTSHRLAEDILQVNTEQLKKKKKKKRPPSPRCCSPRYHSVCAHRGPRWVRGMWKQGVKGGLHIHREAAGAVDVLKTLWAAYSHSEQWATCGPKHRSRMDQSVATWYFMFMLLLIKAYI